MVLTMSVWLSMTRRRVKAPGIHAFIAFVAWFPPVARCSNPAPPPPSPSASAGSVPPPPAPPLPVPPPPAPPPAPVARTSPTCGDNPLPLCPLGSWMKANTGAALNARDFSALAAGFDTVVRFSVPNYANWASIARDGSSSARSENLEAVKAACRGCHSQYRDRYKNEMRDRKLPP